MAMRRMARQWRFRISTWERLESKTEPDLDDVVVLHVDKQASDVGSQDLSDNVSGSLRKHLI